LCDKSLAPNARSAYLGDLIIKTLSACLLRFPLENHVTGTLILGPLDKLRPAFFLRVIADEPHLAREVEDVPLVEALVPSSVLDDVTILLDSYTTYIGS